MCVMSVNLSDVAQPSKSSRDLPQEGSPIGVVSVGKPSMQNHSSVVIREHTREEKPYECMDCGKSSCVSSNLTTQQRTHTHTQGRNPMNVTNVGNPPPVSQPYVSIRRSTRKRNPINALSVGNPAAISQP